MRTRRRIPIKPPARRGLAMLELVLYLPLMLFVMALMMNFGTMAAWKIRAQHNTRYAGWRTLQDRTGQNDPNPGHWPRPATLSTSGGRVMANANAVWNRHPQLTTPVIRGPVIVEPDSGYSITVPGRFNMDATVHAGDSRIRRKLPLLRKLLPNDGTYGYTQHQELLDNRWEYRHLPKPRNPYDRGGVSGDGGNRARRAKRWYRLDPPFFPRLQNERRVLAQADALLKNNPTRFDLDPLDRDPEIYQLERRRVLGDFVGPVPPNHPILRDIRGKDFHPAYDPRRVSHPQGRTCTIDPAFVRNQTQTTIRNIQRLPTTMGRYYEGLYQREIERLQQLDPPPMAEISALEKKLQQVQRFLGALPRQYR